MNLMNLKTDPKLLAALERARNVQPTQEDLYRQRLSFIYGSLPESNTATIDEIDAQLKRQEGKKAR